MLNHQHPFIALLIAISLALSHALFRFRTAEEKPLLALVMMVKNEASQMEELLESVAPYIDMWLIYDTGSTDGTQEIIRAKAKELGIPGQLLEGEFIDYAATRNKVLDLLGDQAVFALMMDGGDVLTNGDTLRSQLKRFRFDLSVIGFSVEHDWSGMRYWFPSITRAANGFCRYKGKVHNYVDCERYPSGNFKFEVLSAVLIVHYTPNTPEEAERKRQKFLRDRAVLEEELRNDPTDTRSAFYLAQTLHDLDLYEEALAAYVRRGEMTNGWEEENVVAYLRAGELCAALADPNVAPNGTTTHHWSECVLYLLSAMDWGPKRVEPYWRLARLFRERNMLRVCGIIAKIGTEVNEAGRGRLPKNSLFADELIYSVYIHEEMCLCGYVVGEMERGLAACNTIRSMGYIEDSLYEVLEKYPAQR